MLFSTTPQTDDEQDPDSDLQPESELQIDNAFYRALLHEMMNVGIGLVRALELKAANSVADCGAPPDDIALSFERITRAVRRSIMLARQLNEPSQAAKTPNPPRSPAAPAPESPTPETKASKPTDQDRPERPGEPATTARTTEPRERPENLSDETPSNRPIPEQIAAIRQDLGLPPQDVAPPPVTPPPPTLTRTSAPWPPSPNPAAPVPSLQAPPKTPPRPP